jgi:hypothetical protein
MTTRSDSLGLLLTVLISLACGTIIAVGTFTAFALGII